MEVQLLPKDSRLVDYKTYESGIIYRQYLLDGHIFHFTLHPELYPEGNELDFTGRYLAVVTSIRGLETFYIAPNEAGELEVDEDDDDFNENAADRQIEKEMGDMLRNANIKTSDSANEEKFDINEYADEDESGASWDDNDELEPVTDEELKWLNFDPQIELLPIMITAIQEFRTS